MFDSRKKAIRALILLIHRDSMELMATPRAICSISGAAVPEEILSTRVCARVRSGEDAGPTHSRDAMHGMYPGLWNAARGRDAANIPARTRTILRTGERKSGPR